MWSADVGFAVAIPRSMYIATEIVFGMLLIVAAWQTTRRSRHSRAKSGTSGGTLEDSARVFPTGTSLLLRAFERRSGAAYPVDQGPVPVDWIAGMFMLFRRETYEAVGGFDEDYFLYYEDVDICWRLHAKGYSVIYDPWAEITHDAQRASRGNLRLAAHHLASIFRYLWRKSG